MMRFIENLNKKKKKGSKRVVEHNWLSSGLFNDQEYLNISIYLEESAGMAEWLMQSVVIRCPSGREGSIPSAGVFLIDNTK